MYKRQHQIEGSDRFIRFGVNVRFFNSEGTEDMLIDTVGMSTPVSYTHLFMPLAASPARDDFFLTRVVGDFEDETLYHFDGSGASLCLLYTSRCV